MAQRVIREEVTTTTPTVVHTTPHVQTNREYAAKKTIFRTYQTLFYILGVLEVLLGFRFLLRLIAANPASGFTQMIYGISAPFAAPFFGIVPAAVAGGSVAEWSTLIAMAVYAVLIWLVVEFFQIVKPVDPIEVEETVDNP